MTREHTSSRKQFGYPLDRFQLVGAHIAEIAACAALVEALLHDAARGHEVGEDAAAGAALQVVAAEAATVAARGAHQCHGAVGVTSEHRLGQYTCRLWFWREDFGDEFSAAAELGEAALDPSGPGLWSLSSPREVAA
jgi:acyl-CoA dehydrogenase